MATSGGIRRHVRYHPGDHDLIVALMLRARRRALTLRVRWHSALDGEGNGYCSMDGNTFRLDMLLERLRRDFPTIAEATVSDPHTPLQRRHLANGLRDILCRSRVGVLRPPLQGRPTGVCPARTAPVIRRLAGAPAGLRVRLRPRKFRTI